MMHPNKRWLRFGLVGLVGIGVQVATLVVLVEHAGVNLQAATLAAVSTAILHNFVWHLRWTWADRASGGPLVLLFARFSAANGFVSLAGNAVLMTVLVEGADVAVATASLIAIGACGVLNYALADRLVFTAPPLTPGGG
jgi:putative flippase GtrA